MNVNDKPINYVDRFSKKILSDQNLLQDLLISLSTVEGSDFWEVDSFQKRLQKIEYGTIMA